MPNDATPATSANAWTLKKAVTTLAIAPQTESLTRAARMTYNVMIFKAQRTNCDAEGGYSAPQREIVKGYGATTRDSSRVRSYIEQMCTTLVRWFPLSGSDEAQASIEGLEPVATASDGEDGRVFTLLSEARFSKRSGEQWVTWFFPPTIRNMIIEPNRWAQLDIKEMSALSYYAGVALYEICARYKDVPGGLTNRAEPSWWVQALRPDPETKPREWRKFKNETLRPAMAEISQKTSLQVDLVEYKKGRAVVEAQFTVRRKQYEPVVAPIDLTLVEHANALGIKERDLDPLVDEFGEEKVRVALDNMDGRQRAQPTVPIKHPTAYLKQTLRNSAHANLFERPVEPVQPLSREHESPRAQADAWLDQRNREISAELDNLPPEELERLAQIARATIVNAGLMTTAMQRRFENRQYQAPMIRNYIKHAYAEERYGARWMELPDSLKPA